MDPASPITAKRLARHGSDLSTRSAALTELARTLTASDNLDNTLCAITGAAVLLIPDVDYADVTLINDGGFHCVARTSPFGFAHHSAQHFFDEGPSLRSAVTASVIRCTDLRADTRWPLFAPAALEAGFVSMLSLPLPNCLGGVLNLLSHTPTSFEADTETIGAVLANQAAIAILRAARQHQNVPVRTIAQQIVEPR